MLLDVLREAERVVADEALGRVRVAGFQRLDDRHVILDRALRPIRLVAAVMIVTGIALIRLQ